ncbi:hypothetical protein [Lentzea sp.]|uniref:hypothetical protein n=1 Tax=Lentzea sp. TaxID=56099 RepID=UPI002ED6580B
MGSTDGGRENVADSSVLPFLIAAWVVAATIYVVPGPELVTTADVTALLLLAIAWRVAAPLIRPSRVPAVLAKAAALSVALHATAPVHVPALADQPAVWSVPFGDVAAVATILALVSWFDDTVVASCSTVWDQVRHRARAWFVLLVEPVPAAAGPDPIRPRALEADTTPHQVDFRRCWARRGPPVLSFA